jgi:hypothetical protein
VFGDWKWWKVAGTAGLLTIVIFIVSFITFGSPPGLDDPAGDVREYFEDSGSLIHFTNWLVAMGIALFFVVFASGLRNLLGPADSSDRGMWSRASFAGAVGVLAIGGAGQVFWGVAALSVDDLSDEVLVALHHMDALIYSTVTPFAFALFLAPASLVIVRSGVLWKWLGWLGLAVALLSVIGALWPLDGDSEGFFGILSFIGFILFFVWILIASIGMIRMESPPAES